MMSLLLPVSLILCNLLVPIFSEAHWILRNPPQSLRTDRVDLRELLPECTEFLKPSRLPSSNSLSTQHIDFGFAQVSALRLSMCYQLVNESGMLHPATTLQRPRIRPEYVSLSTQHSLSCALKNMLSQSATIDPETHLYGATGRAYGKIEELGVPLARCVSDHSSHIGVTPLENWPACTEQRCESPSGIDEIHQKDFRIGADDILMTTVPAEHFRNMAQFPVLEVESYASMMVEVLVSDDLFENHYEAGYVLDALQCSHFLDGTEDPGEGGIPPDVVGEPHRATRKILLPCFGFGVTQVSYDDPTEILYLKCATPLGSGVGDGGVVLVAVTDCFAGRAMQFFLKSPKLRDYCPTMCEDGSCCGIDDEISCGGKEHGSCECGGAAFRKSCNCEHGYSSAALTYDCNTIMRCFNIPYNSTGDDGFAPVCSGRGECRGEDDCDCDETVFYLKKDTLRCESHFSITAVISVVAGGLGMLCLVAFIILGVVVLRLLVKSRARVEFKDPAVRAKEEKAEAVRAARLAEKEENPGWGFVRAYVKNHGHLMATASRVGSTRRLK